MLLAEALFGIFAIFFGVVLSLFTAVLELIASIFGIAVRKSKKAQPIPDAAPPKTQKPWMRKALRFTGITAGIVLAMSLLALTVLQLFFLKPTVRWAANKIGVNHGIDIQIGQTDGNLFVGKLTLTDLQISGSTESGEAWIGSAGHAKVQLDLLRILGNRTWLRDFQLGDCDINVTTPSPGTYDPGSILTRGRSAETPDYREKRRFGIRNLEIDNLSITLNRADADKPTKFVVDRFRGNDIKSEFALFQVFFRSNASGSLNDTPWSIKTAATSDLGRTTEWQFRDVPAETAAHLLGGPILWLQRGRIDIEVIDEWSIGDGPEIDFDWRFVLHDFQAAATTPNPGPVVSAAINHLNQADQPFELRLALELNKDQLQGSASPAALGLGDAMLLAMMSKDEAEQFKESGKKVLDRFFGRDDDH